MDTHSLPYLKEALLFLLIAGVLVPVAQRRQVSGVMAFLVIGSLIGPYGPGTAADAPAWLAYFVVTDNAHTRALAELGVVFLLFLLGLELSAERLWQMRRLVFGAGTLQWLLCAVAIGACAGLWGHPPASAAVLGLTLALSSTAVVMQMLADRREQATPLGRASFAVLLLQDFAVVPLLLLVNTLGHDTGEPLWRALGGALLKTGAAVALILLLGRGLLRPAFRHVGALRQPESLMALTLLAILGLGAITAQAGLSMALGAFLAGILLAETEFQHEIGVLVTPFKGLLMGLFFLTVGMGLDLRALLYDPLSLLAAVAGLFVLKGIITCLVLTSFGLPRAVSLEAGILLGQGGEFGFVVMALASQVGLLSAAHAQFMLLVVGLSMLSTPLLSRPAHELGLLLGRIGTRRHTPVFEATLPEQAGHVLIAGFGRVGQVLAQVLDSQRVPYLALDNNTHMVGALRAQGYPVFSGDASQLELLRAAGLERAQALIVTMDHTHAAHAAVRAARSLAPEVPIYARARDLGHAQALRAAGASAVIPEALEASLQLAGEVLEAAGLQGEALQVVLAQHRERLGTGPRDRR